MPGQSFVTITFGSTFRTKEYRVGTKALAATVVRSGGGR